MIDIVSFMLRNQDAAGNLSVQVSSNGQGGGHAGNHARIAASDTDDIDLVSRALARDGHAFRAIMKRNNQRLYRLARAIVRDDAEAEDVVQEAECWPLPTSQISRATPA